VLIISLNFQNIFLAFFLKTLLSNVLSSTDDEINFVFFKFKFCIQSRRLGTLKLKTVRQYCINIVFKYCLWMYGILRRSKAFLREELNPFWDTVLKGRIWVFLCVWKLPVFSFALNYKNRIWRNEVLSRKQELAVKNDANTAPDRYTQRVLNYL